jgi:hypothetical protein
MRMIEQKFILLVLSLTLLVAVTFYATQAWFTKMTSVSGLRFDVAQWDFAANQLVDDRIVNVYQYASLANQVAAPGTAGIIPIELSATDSQTDIDYYITVDKSSMGEEFQDRIFFYFKDETTGLQKEFLNEGEDLAGTLLRGQTKVITIYWKWIYELELIPEGQDDAYTPEQLSIMAEHDRYDTLVGKNPALFATLMNARVLIAGAQVQPAPEAGP